jgi:tyrosinase
MTLTAPADLPEISTWDSDPEGTIERINAYVWDRRLSRRQLLQLGAWGALALALSACTSAAITALLDQIKNRPVRHDISSLGASDPIVVAYRTAVQKLRDADADPTKLVTWTKQAAIHKDHCPHGNWLFLPWHRAYLLRFEAICRDLSGMKDFALPYWNWSANPSLPAVFWNSGDSLFDGTRGATASSTVDPAVFAPLALEPIQDEPNFLIYASGQIPLSAGQRQQASFGPLEGGPHNVLHGFVGGHMGFVSQSPLDPIFWMHHNMIEAMWVDWNIKRGHPNTNDTAWVNRTFTDFVDTAGAPVSTTVLETILYPFFSYRFDDPVIGVP